MNTAEDLRGAGSLEPTTDSDAGETEAAEFPLALAYVRQHLLMRESEVNRTKERLSYFARVAGFELGAVYVEEVQSCPTAFEALIEAALLERPKAILVPSLLHLAVLGAPTTITRHVERLTGAQVIAVTDVVSYMPGVAVS